MIRYFDVMEKHGKLIRAIENERLTKQEIIDKGIPGVNKNTINSLIKIATEEGVLLTDGDHFYLNTSVLSSAFSEAAEALDLLPSTVEARETTPADYGLPELPPPEQKKVSDLETEIEGLTEQISVYETATNSLKEEVEKLRSENEALHSENETLRTESATADPTDEGKNITSEQSPAFSADNLLASINEKIDERMEEITKRLTEQMSEMSSTALSAIATATATKTDTEAEKIEGQKVQEAEAKVREAEAKTKEQEQKIEAYKEEIANLNKKLSDIKNEVLADVKKEWEEIRNSLYADPTIALPSGVVVAYDERSGGNVKREGKVETVPYFPGKPHACEANRPPFFYFPENMTTDAMERENVRKTAGVFSSMTKLYKQAAQSKDKEKTFSDGKEQLVMELLQNGEKNDVQKISEYSVIRTLNGEYFNLLLAAVQNGLKASDIIAFLEAPPESFNMEVVRHYVSLAMNERNSNMRLEVARDLIDRKWSINDGKDEYVLYSKEEIDALRAMLEGAGKVGAETQEVPAQSPVQENDTQTETGDNEEQPENPMDDFESPSFDGDD